MVLPAITLVSDTQGNLGFYHISYYSDVKYYVDIQSHIS